MLSENGWVKVKKQNLKISSIRQEMIMACEMVLELDIQRSDHILSIF
jgi:hypothetical protein